MSENLDFDEIADAVEKKLHNDVRILCEQDYEGKWHVDVQEIADDDEEEEDVTDDGYFSIRTHVADNLEDAAKWLKKYYL